MKGRLYARWLAAEGMTLEEFVAAEREATRWIRRAARTPPSVFLGMQQSPHYGLPYGLGAPVGLGDALGGASPLARLFFGQ